MAFSSKQELCRLIVKNTFLHIDDSDSEEDGGLMCKQKTEPAPRRPTQDELLSDASEEVDYQACSSLASTDDEFFTFHISRKDVRDAPMGKPGLSLPIRRRTLRFAWADDIEEDLHFVVATPSTVNHLTLSSKSVDSDINQDSGFVAPTPSTVRHLSPWSKSRDFDLIQDSGFAASTPSTVGHLTPRMAPERFPDWEICNSAQACAAQSSTGVAFPDVKATLNLTEPPCAHLGWSLAEESIEKTGWEKFEEAVDGVQKALSSYRGLVADVKVVEGAHGWTLTAFVNPEELMPSREHLEAGAKRALIAALVALEGVYTLGFQQPFVPTEFGFESTLALVTDPECACWDMFATGFCPYPGCCQKQHPSRQNKANLNVMFKPA